MRRLRAALVAVAVAASALVAPIAIAPAASAHGWITSPPSRQDQCATGATSFDCGSIKYEPQSVEAPKGSMQCSGGSGYAILDDESKPWPRTTTGRDVTFQWKLTANHATSVWEYFVDGELFASFGARLPVEPRRGQMLALGHVPAVLSHCVHGDDVYLVPRPSGELLVGATVERVGFQRGVTASGIAGLLAAAVELCPALGALPITRTWWGFRPWAPDSLPVLGPWPEVENLWVASAHYRNGILLAPITGRLMTRWLTTGHPEIDVDEFSPARFVRRAPAARD